MQAGTPTFLLWPSFIVIVVVVVIIVVLPLLILFGVFRSVVLARVRRRGLARVVRGRGAGNRLAVVRVVRVFEVFQLGRRALHLVCHRRAWVGRRSTHFTLATALLR